MKQKAPRQPATFVKTTIFLFWIVLFALLLKRDFFVGTIDMEESSAITQAEREEYQSIYFHNKKIGFVVSTFEPGDDRSVALTQKARMILNIAGDRHPVDLHLKARISPESRLKEFTFSFLSPFYRMEADGEASGNSVSFTLSTSSSTIHDAIELKAPPMLSTSRRTYLLKPDIKAGDKFRIPWFDPLTLAAKDSVIEYRGREKVLIHGRVQNLHSYVETFSGMRISSWLDDNGDVLKEETPAGFVFLKEPKFKALAEIDESPELLSAAAAKLIGTMPDIAQAERMRYRLHFPDDGSFQLDSGRQQYAAGLLTIERESLDDRAAKQTACTSAPADLAATRMVQADHPKIKALAAELAAGKTTALDTAEAIAAWIHDHLEQRPVIGLPDALSVLDSRMGDCNEHAVLFAALARAAGIPCRIAAGVMYLRDAFYYHAWNEICVDGRWITVDTTTNQLPADLSHIKFIEGETRDQMRIGALLGQLAIEPLPHSAANGSAAEDRHRQGPP